MLIILILAVSSITIIEPVFAQLIPKPSVPEFTVQVIEYGYQMNILNQPVIPNGHDTAQIFYNIRIKSHTTENWVNTTVPNPSQAIRGYIGEIGQSGYTTLANDFNNLRLLLNLSSESQQIDFQVEAINGYLNTTPAFVPPIDFDPNSTPVIIVNTSGWSNSQTITLPVSPTSSTVPTSPTPTPTTSPTSSTTTNPSNTPTPASVKQGDIIKDVFLPAVALVGFLVIILILLVYIRRQPKAKLTE